MLGIVKADGRKIPLGNNSVQCVVTPPPYWGLRKYAGEQELVWGGPEDCDHSWEQKSDNAEGYTGRKRWQHGATRQENPAGWSTAIREHGTCQLCGAWRGAYGLEPTVEMYVQHTVEILREIRRVLRGDGVVFWNIGDSYAGFKDCKSVPDTLRKGNQGTAIPKGLSANRDSRTLRQSGLKNKDLCLIPFRVALAAQADGWWVRSDIIWAKPNPMPESVTDRPTRSHEYILMLTKNSSYYWDAEAASERSVTDPDSKASMMFGSPSGKHNTPELAHAADLGHKWDPTPNRNLRSVWEMTTQPFGMEQCASCKTVYDLGAFQRLASQDEKHVCSCGSSDWVSHFATFPEELPKRCILAATRTGDLVLDPFAGSGTVGKVAIELGRRAILCDLAYQDLASKRTAAIQRPLIALQGELSG